MRVERQTSPDNRPPSRQRRPTRGRRECSEQPPTEGGTTEEGALRSYTTRPRRRELLAAARRATSPFCPLHHVTLGRAFLFIDYSLTSVKLHKRQRRPASRLSRHYAQNIIAAETRINAAKNLVFAVEIRINAAKNLVFTAKTLYND